MAARRRGTTSAIAHAVTWTTYVEGLAFRVFATPRTDEQAAGSPAIVLVHGIGVSHRYLSRLHDALATERTVFSIDLPGFGGLPKPGRDVDVATMADALATVVAALDAGPVVLVGHSMGSQWVVELGVRHPELVTDVVAMGPVADTRHRTVMAQTIALALDTLGEPLDINAVVFTDYLRCGIPWYLTQLRHMLGYPIEERVPALSIPLLLIRGGRDPIAGVEWCRMLRDRSRQATLVHIPGQHHVAQQSAPRAVAAAITAHVTGARSPR
jgi:pimeloyl-ACP methyl ester carboxylesterase